MRNGFFLNKIRKLMKKNCRMIKNCCNFVANLILIRVFFI